MVQAQGVSKETRRFLEILHREFPGPFSVEEAAEVLPGERVWVRRLLAHLATQGWLSRIRRNVYVTVPLGAKVAAQWRADPWVVAAKVFEPCYLGGWTACEHWGLTEQVFRSMWVVTSRPVSPRTQDIQDTVFQVKVTSAERLFGLTTVWRRDGKIRVSNPTRTVVDVLDDPRLGGGIRHISGVVNRYFESEHREDSALLDFAGRLGNGAVFKRLGFLLETLGLPLGDLIESCLLRISSGVVLLDPSGPMIGETDRRWGLRVNVRVKEAAS